MHQFGPRNLDFVRLCREDSAPLGLLLMTGRFSWPDTRESLLLQIRQVKDHEAWTTFVDIYAPLVYWYCTKRGLQDADANDVVQDVFRNVSQGIAGFDYDPQIGRFRDWLRTVCRHAVIRHLNRSKRIGHEAGIGGESNLFESVDGESDTEWIEQFGVTVLRAAIERIRPEFDSLTWQAFEWVWIEDRESQAVAEELQKTVNWVYKAKFRVFTRLKAEVRFLCADTASLQK